MKINIVRLIEVASLVIFGFVGFLYTIYQWSEKNVGITIIFGVLFVIVLYLVGFTASLINEKEENKYRKGWV